MQTLIFVSTENKRLHIDTDTPIMQFHLKEKCDDR
jgi:hypothetical protein